MANNRPDLIRIAAGATFRSAPLGTVAPTDATTAFSALWNQLGYVADGGGTIAQNQKTKPLYAWQSTEPLRVIIESLSRTIAFETLQSDKANLQLALGGGTVTQNGVSTSGAITFTAGTITSATPHGLTAGMWCFFGTVTGTPGVVAGVNYYVLTAPTTSTVTLAASIGGAQIAITTGTALSLTNAAPATMVIPDTAVSYEFAFAFDWSDGVSGNTRLIFPRCTLNSLPPLKYGRTDQTRYGVDIAVLKPLDASQSMVPYFYDPAASS